MVPDASDTKRRLRVLTLVDRLGTSGGGERLAMQIAMRLDRERFESWYCVSRWEARDGGPREDAEAVAALRAADVKVVGLGRSSSAAVWSWWPFVRLLRRERIDVVHSHKFGSNVWAAALAPLAGVPVVVAHEHSWSFEGRPLRRFLDRNLIARRTGAMIAVSREDRRRMIEIERIDPLDVTFVANGIQPLEAGEPGRLRAELGLRDDDPVIGTVAVLRPEKRLDLVLRALAQLSEELPRVALVVAGEGPERPLLERLATELGVAERVHLLGHRTDVPDVLAGIDVAVSASEREGSPLAVMEYMEAGVPVVATRVGGLPDLIDDGVHGRLVPSGDAGALAGALGELLRHPDARRAMGERARERRRAEFDLDVVVRRLERIYEQLHEQA